VNAVVNTRADVGSGGDGGDKVAVVGNTLGKEKTRLNQSRISSNIEGS
jgi:hypothetical protein